MQTYINPYPHHHIPNIKKKPDDDAFVPMCPSVLERIGEMSQMRLDVCARLPSSYPFQPPVIEPL